MSSRQMSLRAYGRHRKELGLPGQTHASIRKAIDRETLVKSVSYDGKGNVRINPEVADQEWIERTDPVQQREPEDARGRWSEGVDAAEQGALFPDDRPVPAAAEVNKGPNIKTAQAVRLSYQARLAQLDYEERSKQLCKVEAVRIEAFRLGRVVRDKMLNIPDLVCAQVAAETDPHACREILLRELVVALQEFSDAEGKEYA